MRARNLIAAGAALALLPAGAAAASPDRDDHAATRHVLLLSIDGLHQSDLDWWVRSHPGSALARVVHHGTSYVHARTPLVSDSFPGLVAQVTGGDPATTGIYYDDSWNRALLAPGSACTPGQTTGLGTEVNYSEALARNADALDSGFGLPSLYAGLPESILALPGDVATIDASLIDPAALPIDPATCRPVFPHAYLRTNTVFEVAHAAGLRTAWSDKHAAYELVAGPSGRGVDDLFVPEINSSTVDPALPAGAGPDWTASNADTQRYDDLKVEAVLNELDGRDHSGTTRVGVPAILGMNFQSVSTAQKLPRSPLAGAPQAGGYVEVAGRWVPGPVLQSALGFVDLEVGRMLEELHRHGLRRSTTLILSAKHGQSPIETTSLLRIDDGKVLDALNAAWRGAGHAGDLVAFAIDDDAMLLWLADRSDAARTFARSFLLGYSQPASAHAATDSAGSPVGFSASGLARIVDGPAFLGTPAGDSRAPDLVGIVQHGVVYTAKTKKIAEHGGTDPQDSHVPLVVYGAGAPIGRQRIEAPVETTQIAPSILALLGLDPWRLTAVQREGTPLLPHLDRRREPLAAASGAG